MGFRANHTAKAAKALNGVTPAVENDDEIYYCITRDTAFKMSEEPF